MERFSLPGRGVAYGTQFGLHLLNIPAGGMSAFPEQPDHFLHWAQANYDAGTTEDDFLPRRIYGQYVESVLREAVETHGNPVEWRQDEALSIYQVDDHVEVRLRSGPKIVADKVVLATGNFHPSDPDMPGRKRSDKRYVPYAWSAGALQGVEEESSILLIGSGLTSVDTALALRAREFRGTIHVLSRRGVIPEWHKKTTVWPTFWSKDSGPTTVRGLVKLVRAQGALAAKQGIDWRPVVDALRPVSGDIWHALSAAEKRRFLRHLRPYWEVHRHRVSPKIGSLMLYQVLRDDMQVHTGRVVGYQEFPEAVEVTIRDRRAAREKTILVERIINCTGPETDCRRLDESLITNLIAQGLARPDALFLGLDVNDEGALMDHQGAPSTRIYTLGPPRKGQLWETTAVPEIRVQVAGLARQLLERTAALPVVSETQTTEEAAPAA
ncbi:MAG: FAD/NAD(P)-binding protein [Acidobacteriales bacterium]|nr:FAD/NAD(P)-binding protein [Terriglobales bacterium]